MSTEAQKNEAARIRAKLARVGGIPNSLRGPLQAVETGTEVAGTANDVLMFAAEAYVRLRDEKTDR